MHLLPILASLTLPMAALATIGGHCTGSKATGLWKEDGICTSKSTCNNYSGATTDGACPSDPAKVKCCLVGLGPAVSNNPCGGTSYCDWTSNTCNGDWVPGFCPGGSNYKCCKTS